MIRPDIHSPQQPSAQLASLSNRVCDRFTLVCIESDRIMVTANLVLLVPCPIWLKERSAVLVVEAIDRSALIAVQPSAIATKRDQVSQGDVATHRAQYTEPTCGSGWCLRSLGLAVEHQSG